MLTLLELGCYNVNCVCASVIGYKCIQFSDSIGFNEYHVSSGHLNP